MGEARRRRAKRWHYGFDDFDIPINEFRAVFDLTKNEAQNEFAAGRLSLRGVPVEGVWRELTVRESRAKAWVLRKDLPAPVRAKIEEAGGLRALQVWRDTWFDRMVIDFENSRIIWPDGTVFTNVQVRKSEVDQMIRLSRH